MLDPVLNAAEDSQNDVRLIIPLRIATQKVWFCEAIAREQEHNGLSSYLLHLVDIDWSRGR